MLYVSIELEPGHWTGPRGKFWTRLLIYSESLKKLLWKDTRENAASVSSFLPNPRFKFFSAFSFFHPPLPTPIKAGWWGDDGSGYRAGAERPGAEESAERRPSPASRQRGEWLEVSFPLGTRSCFLSPACLPFSRTVSLALSASSSLPPSLFSPPPKRSNWLQSSWQPDGLSSRGRDRDGKIL